MPLSRRMVFLLLFMMAVALTVAGTLMIGILQRQLTAQVDQQLRTSANQLAATTIAAEQQSHTVTTAMPSEYYVRSMLVGENGEVTTGFEFLSDDTAARAGRPDVDDLDVTVYADNGEVSYPVTVSSSLQGATWRIVTISVSVQGGIGSAELIGYITVGLPLVDITETLQSTAYAFTLSALSLLLVSALIGFYLVRRSLRPLQTIESVAGRIAAGDLSCRIPPSPPSTEVGSLSLSLNKMLGRIEESFAAQQASEAKQRQFVSDASHELRTPLAAIRGYAELYRIGAIPEDDVIDAMERIESEATRMGSLVENLLALARIDEDRPLDISEVDLVQVAKDSRSDLHALDSQRKVKLCNLEGKRAPSSLVIQADRDRLTQVFVNLAGNIARYTPEGSPVDIAVGLVQQVPVQGVAGVKTADLPTTGNRRHPNGYHGPYAIIEFRDHGPGIPAAEQDRVFERFYRTDKSRSRAMGGSGLGLSIVAGIISAHDGSIWMSTTEPHGLTVHMALPLE